MCILLAHEMGHYVAARLHGVPASLPYFIPLPGVWPLGTMGAVIGLDGSRANRKEMFDMGISGPLAGLVSYELLACSPPDLVVDDVTMPPFRACGTVSTAASGFTVGFGEDVIFHAGSKIELGDGFVVESGGSFTGWVDY